MTSGIKRIAVSTGGGDAPGLDAVSYAGTLAARNRGWDVAESATASTGCCWAGTTPTAG